MRTFVRFVDQLNGRVGGFVSYFNHLLVWVICIDVLMRYFLNESKIWITELETYFYAFIFLLGSGFAFSRDRHVRVDVFYAKMSLRRKAWVDIFGGLFLLLPWVIVVMMVSFNYAQISFRIGESSAQPGGLPAVWILKSVVFFGFFLLSLQGVANIFRAIIFLKEGGEKYPDLEMLPKVGV